MSTILPQMISLSHFFLVLFLNTLYSVQIADQHYLHTFDSSSKWTFSEVQSKPLTPFQETLSKGLKSGVYWIQIPPNSTSQVFVIENHRIKTPTAFSGSTPLRWEKDTRYPTLVLPKNQSVWIRIDSSTNIHFPFPQYGMDKFDNLEQQRFFNLGLYYGFVFMVFVLNIFYSRKAPSYTMRFFFSL